MLLFVNSQRSGWFPGYLSSGMKVRHELRESKPGPKRKTSTADERSGVNIVSGMLQTGYPYCMSAVKICFG